VKTAVAQQISDIGCVGVSAETPEDDEPFWSTSARANSAQRENRSLGFLARATDKTGSSAFSSGRVSASAGGGELRCRLGLAQMFARSVRDYGMERPPMAGEEL
jgi:hypothetical protein